MNFKHLTKAQIRELKQRYLTDHNENVSYSEIADADKAVSDKDLQKEYGDTEFHPDDFFCTEGKSEAQCLLQNYKETDLDADVGNLVDSIIDRIQHAANSNAIIVTSHSDNCDDNDTEEVDEELYNIYCEAVVKALKGE